MALFIPTPNTLQLDAIYTCQGERMENIYHVQGTGITDLNALANKVMDQYVAWETAHVNQIRGNGAQLINLVVHDMGTQNGQVWQRSVVGPISTASAAMLPNNCTIAVKWLTGYAGRANRGRTYHIGLNEAMVTGNDVVSSVQTALIAAYADLLTKLTDSTVFTGFVTTAQMVVVSKHFNKLPRAAGVTKAITGCTLTDAHVDSQRRRLPGHNRHA